MNKRLLAADGSAAPAGCQDGSAAVAGTAERIRALSLELFARKGYAATSVRDIAQAGGITPGAIYNHFAAKEDVLAAIVVDTHASLLEHLEREAEAAAADGAGPAVRVERLVRAFARHVVRQPGASRAAEREFTHLAPAPRARVDEQRRSILLLLEDALLEAVAAGELALPEAGALGARRVATSVANMLTGLFEALPEELAEADALVELHVALVLRMLAPR